MVIVRGSARTFPRYLRTRDDQVRRYDGSMNRESARRTSQALKRWVPRAWNLVKRYVPVRLDAKKRDWFWLTVGGILALLSALHALQAQEVRSPPAIGGESIGLTWRANLVSPLPVPDMYSAKVDLRITSCSKPVGVDVVFSFPPAFWRRYGQAVRRDGDVGVAVSSPDATPPAKLLLYTADSMGGMLNAVSAPTAETVGNGFRRLQLSGERAMRLKLQLSAAADGENVPVAGGGYVTVRPGVGSAPPGTAVVLRANEPWLVPRSPGTCYLHVPELVDTPVAQGLARSRNPFVPPRTYVGSVQDAILTNEIQSWHDRMPPWLLQRPVGASAGAVTITGSGGSGTLPPGDISFVHAGQGFTDTSSDSLTCSLAGGVGPRSYVVQPCENVLEYAEPGAVHHALVVSFISSLAAGVFLGIGATALTNVGIRWTGVRRRPQPEPDDS
jgi:hypothetical protein